MILLTFAHKREAEIFLKHDKFVPYNFLFPGVYKTNKNEMLLLITGEGVQNSTEKLSSIMTHFYQEITDVVNLGIAASVDKSLNLHDIYSIQSCYKEQAGLTKPHPKVLKTADLSAKLSCITTNEKILNRTRAEKLSKLASIIDMESWAIGSVCKLFDVPFLAYKLISDFPGHDPNHSQELDQKIKKNSMFFGQTLFDYYKEYIKL